MQISRKLAYYANPNFINSSQVLVKYIILYVRIGHTADQTIWTYFQKQCSLYELSAIKKKKECLSVT